MFFFPPPSPDGDGHAGCLRFLASDILSASLFISTVSENTFLKLLFRSTAVSSKSKPSKICFLLLFLSHSMRAERFIRVCFVLNGVKADKHLQCVLTVQSSSEKHTGLWMQTVALFVPFVSVDDLQQTKKKNFLKHNY